MTTADPSSWWTALTAAEQASLEEVYLRQRTFTEAAARLRTSVEEVARVVQSAYRRIADVVLSDD